MTDKNTHWSNDDQQRQKFWDAVTNLWLDPDEAKAHLGVADLRHFPGTMGDALNAIKDALDKQAKATPAAAVAQGNLYPDEETRLLAEAIARVAPWAHNKNFPLDAADIALAVQRSVTMGLDPLNPHEVQIWKANRGLNFQLAYTLLHQWASQILGGHTEPRYTRLTKEELTAEGLLATDIAYHCQFVMRDDIHLIGTMMKAGWEPLQARAELTVRGLGTATQSEWDGRYFAPSARSKAWKVKKRAYTDAIRTRFGTPSQPVIEEMRRLRGEDHIAATDWQITAGADSAEERVRLAALTADARECEPDDRTPEEILAEGRRLLRGDDDEIGEVAATSPSAEEPKPEPKAEELESEVENDPDLPVAWKAYADKAVKELHYQDIYQVIKVLKQAGISPVSDADGNCTFGLADAWTILSEHDHDAE